MKAFLGERGQSKRCRCGWISTVPMRPMPIWMAVIFRFREFLRTRRGATLENNAHEASQVVIDFGDGPRNYFTDNLEEKDLE